MKFDVVTVGSAAVDYFADTDSELIRIDTKTRKIELIAFPLGSKLLIRELLVLTGGGGTNTAVSFARLGFSTGYLGKLGDDGNGEFIIDSLAKEGISFIGAREGQTGMSIILDSINDDRSILAFKGANDQLHPSDVPEFESQWIYMSSMLGQSFDTVTDLVASGRYKVAFNPSNYQTVRGYDGLKQVIDHCTILIMNREEACEFLGFTYSKSPSIAVLMAEMEKLPPKIFGITDGAGGVYIFDRTHLYHGKPSPDLVIAETTGAGDAFSSTFTAMIMKGLSVKDAIHYAMTNSESVISHKGAKEILLTWEQLQKAASSTPRSIDVGDLQTPPPEASN
ncbi:Predicted carbohydrate kinase, PfkB [gamma proteobacterium HdN1]|nr:Predicted carbohydrate kinase, PfkB [gamma proteobacterium HdN1]